jgi:uncharacterized protein
MSNAIIGLCVIELHLPGLTSLKEKRGILKSMLARMRRTFNVSAAETGHHDTWQSAQIAVASVGNSSKLANQVMNNVITWIEANYPDVMIIKQEIEIL